MHGYLDTHDTLDSRQFVIAVKRLADSLSYGTDRSPFLGSGLEYVQSRRYQWGDPVRLIDWKVTARTQKYFVKEYEVPKRLPCYLMVDTSASMTISSRKRSKYATAIHIAGGLALACLDRVSPVGVIGVGEREFRVDPSLSKQQILQWLHKLRHFRYDETTSLSRRIAELASLAKTRALVVVLSDLHERACLPALKHLAQGHDCVVLQLRDPGEEGLQGAGLMRVREAETGREFVTHGRRQWLDQETINDELRRGGIDHLLLRTDERIAIKLRHFFQSRDLLGRGAR
jgi:uncharacterized protein (DUF58 family)